MVYFDFASNTPVDEEVLDEFYDASLKYYGNPNSTHKLGREANKKIEDSTASIAKLLKVEKEEIIYTSGATEANNLAIKGTCKKYIKNGKHIILSSLEHSSIIKSAIAMQNNGFEIDFIPVKENGLVNVEKLKDMIREDTILVSVVSVDSELGLVQPIEEIGELLKDYPNIYFHSDASQSIGKVDIDYSNVDLITISPHNFYGLNDIGILVKKKKVNLKPIFSGGISTTEYRSGTPNTAGIIACAFALKKALKQRKKRYKYVKELNKYILEFLKGFDKVHINTTEESIPFTINFSVKGVSSQRVVDILDKKGIYLSAKTSSLPKDIPSKLVFALTKDKSLAASSIRISLSHLNTISDVDEFIDAFDDCLMEIENNGKI